MELRDRQELNKGFGETLARAFELVLTPMVFGLLGWWLDGRLGTRPLFMLVLFLLVIGYMAWKMFGRYNVEMKAHEARLLGRRDGDDR